MTDVPATEGIKTPEAIQPDNFERFLQRLQHNLEVLNKTGELPAEFEGLANLVRVEELQAIYRCLIDPKKCDQLY